MKQKISINTLENQRATLLKASKQLNEALKLDPNKRIHKDGTIQRFEFCFELSWKFFQSLSRYNGIDVYGPRKSIRGAAKLKVIDDTKQWISFLEARNLATHTYSETIANEVYDNAKQFAKKLKSVLKRVENDLLFK